MKVNWFATHPCQAILGLYVLIFLLLGYTLSSPANAAGFKFKGTVVDVKNLGPRGIAWHGCEVSLLANDGIAWKAVNDSWETCMKFIQKKGSVAEVIVTQIVNPEDDSQYPLSFGRLYIQSYKF